MVSKPSHREVKINSRDFHLLCNQIGIENKETQCYSRLVKEVLSQSSGRSKNDIRSPISHCQILDSIT